MRSSRSCPRTMEGLSVSATSPNPRRAGSPTTEGYSGTTGWPTPSEPGGTSIRRLDRARTVTVHGGPATSFWSCRSRTSAGPSADRFSWDEEAHLFVGRRSRRATAADRLARDRSGADRHPSGAGSLREGRPADHRPGCHAGPADRFPRARPAARISDSLRSGRPATRRFWAHIEALRQIHAIDDLSYRRDNRHTASQLVPTTEGVRQCVA